MLIIVGSIINFKSLAVLSQSNYLPLLERLLTVAQSTNVQCIKSEIRKKSVSCFIPAVNRLKLVLLFSLVFLRNL